MAPKFLVCSTLLKVPHLKYSPPPSPAGSDSPNCSSKIPDIEEFYINTVQWLREENILSGGNMLDEVEAWVTIYNIWHSADLANIYLGSIMMSCNNITGSNLVFKFSGVDLKLKMVFFVNYHLYGSCEKNCTTVHIYCIFGLMDSSILIIFAYWKHFVMIYGTNHSLYQGQICLFANLTSTFWGVNSVHSNNSVLLFTFIPSFPVSQHQHTWYCTLYKATSYYP